MINLHKNTLLLFGGTTQTRGFTEFYEVNPIEKKDGSEIYMQLRGNIRKAGKGNRKNSKGNR